MSEGKNKPIDRTSIHQTRISREQQELDARLRILTDEVLPKQPYIVTLPTDSPWQTGSRPLPRWYAGTPFSREEEQLQYLSFIPYHGEYLGEGIIIISEGGWSDDKGNILRDDPKAPTRPPSSSANSQRKKITLDAYKNKGQGGTSEEVTIDMERAQASIRKADETFKQSRQPEQRARSNGVTKDGEFENKKRSREETDANHKSTNESYIKSPHPEKRARTSPPPPKVALKQASNASSPKHVDPIFPMLESPTLPPVLDDIILPPLVSPTLPPVLEKLLADKPVKPPLKGVIEQKRPDSAASTHTNHDSDLSPAPRVRVRNVDSPMVSAQNTPKVTPTKNTEAPKRNHLDKVKGRDRGLSNSSDQSKQSPAVNGNDPTSEPQTDRSPPSKLRVILRYGKKNRKRVEQLLRFAPRTKKAPTPSTPTPSHFKRGLEEQFEKESSQRPEKRLKVEQSDTKVARKTPSLLNLSDKPSTPAQSSYPSPGLQSSFSKSAFSTPQKSLKSAAMRRVESSEGPLEARTPQAASRTSTPVSSERSRQDTTSRSSPPTSHPLSTEGSTGRRADWQGQHAKFYELGRRLKRQAATADDKRSQSDPTQNLPFALWMEALLCFILANYCSDRKQGSPDWRGTLAYLEFVRTRARHPDMAGLVLHIAAVVRNQIHRCDMERLHRRPFPFESSSTSGLSAQGPGSDSKNRPNSEENDARKSFTIFQKQCYDNFQKLNELWVEANRRLTPERLERKYPSTWTKKVTLVDKVKDDSIQPGEPLAGHFSFPVDATTSSLEAVRLGMKMLKEWCKNESVDWTPQLQL